MSIILSNSYRYMDEGTARVRVMLQRGGKLSWALCKPPGAAPLQNITGRRSKLERPVTQRSLSVLPVECPGVTRFLDGSVDWGMSPVTVGWAMPPLAVEGKRSLRLMEFDWPDWPDLGCLGCLLDDFEPKIPGLRFSNSTSEN
jgi:hypothetical protein